MEDASIALTMPAHLRIGPRSVDCLPGLVESLGAKRPLLVTDQGIRDAGHVEPVITALAARCDPAPVWDAVDVHTSASCVIECANEIRLQRTDLVVALGGGSVIDAAKAAAAFAVHDGPLSDYFELDGFTHRGPGVVAIPTTLGNGAECSRHAVVMDTAEHRKIAVSGPSTAPIAVVLDPEMAATAPTTLIVDNALDSLLHALEAHLARRSTCPTRLFSLAAVPLLSGSLLGAVQGDADQRCVFALGSLYAGIAMANANAGAAHALGYPLTNRYGIGHGRANALVAPVTLERIRDDCEARQDEVAAAWEGPRAAGEADAGVAALVRLLLQRLDIDPALSSYGVPRDALPSLAAQATGYGPVLSNSPFPWDEASLLEAYEACWSPPRRVLA